MKKFAFSLMIASATVFGVGTAASAQYGGTTTTPTTVAPTTVAPTTTALGSGAGLPTTVAPTVTAPAAGLPATGSSGMGATTGIAVGLFVVGLGLFAATRLRRTHPDAA